MKTSGFHYRTLFEGAVYGVLLTTVDGGRVLDANHWGCSLLRRTRREFLGEEVDVFDPSDERLARASEEQWRTGSFEGELRLLRRDGTAFEAEVVAGTEVGGVGGLVVFFQAKDPPPEFEEGEEPSSSLQATDLVAICEADGTLRYLSPSSERVLGYRPEELVGTVALGRVHPDDLTQLLDAMVEAKNEPGPGRAVWFRTRHKDGSWRHFEAVPNDLLGDPQVRGMVIHFRDVTGRARHLEGIVDELKERERTLEEIEQRCRANFERAVGIAHVLPGGRFLRVNQKFLEISGFSRGDIFGLSSIDAIIHPDDQEADRRKVQEIVRSEFGEYSSEKRYVRKDGSEVWVDSKVVFARRSPDLPGHLVVMVEDVSRRKEIELILRSLVEREREVLELIRRGRSNPNIAGELHLSTHTVKHHVRNVIGKLGASDRTQAAVKAIELGSFERR